jgi:hypothetical protein
LPIKIKAMKYFFLIFLIPFFEIKYPIPNHENCNFMQGIYTMSNGEKWRLRATRHSPEDYFIFECMERDCNDAPDQVTFRYFDCDSDMSNSVVKLCPEDHSKNTNLVFSECTSYMCGMQSEEHFSKIAFRRRESEVWTGKYSCSDN